MPAIVALVYITVLSLVLLYAMGGLGLGVAIFLLLGYIVASELLKAKHDEEDTHHHNAHGGKS
jgi:hypothetical protein